jgi:hypothetical protein
MHIWRYQGTLTSAVEARGVRMRMETEAANLAETRASDQQSIRVSEPAVLRTPERVARFV